VPAIGGTRPTAGRLGRALRRFASEQGILKEDRTMKTFALAMVMAVLASSAALAKTGGEEIPQGHRASQSSGAQQGR
jgi:hypothetical protein